MSDIKAIYARDPSFPASDQHPSASRYLVGGWIVDAVGGEPTTEEAEAFLTPTPTPPHLNGGGLARFTGTAPVEVSENIRLGIVTRISKGRWRAGLAEEITGGFSAIPAYVNTDPRHVWVSAITSTYVEIRARDLTGAAADCQQVMVKIERVVTP